MELSQLIDRVKRGSGGVVIRKQTTYVDVAANSETFRINYRGKREFHLAGDRFVSISVHAEHPLLMDYLEPMVPVHLASHVDNKEKFRELLEAELSEVFGKWRSLDRYLNLPLERFLEKSYGLLMTAPESFARLAVTRAEEIGVQLILHKGYKEKGQPKVILMDDNFVIADEFRAESLHTVENINA